ncbi:MAG: F0F1 ATP synthase subunit B' [Oscillatoriales cyanobacterium SM2_2_1]|nr:F0F1 ATP synthase subunit B' [Oscillatoriales cyanobacterium SM2_2_1]
MDLIPRLSGGLSTHWVLLAAEAEGKGGLFDVDATLPIMAIQFLILVAILNELFFKPLMKVIDERDQSVRFGIAEAKERLSKAKSMASDYEKQLAQTRRDIQELIAAAQADANKIRNQQIADALTEAQLHVQNAKAEIEQQKQEVSAALDQQVTSLSHQILTKILGDLVQVS